jgi:hypothetical protein
VVNKCSGQVGFQDDCEESMKSVSLDTWQRVGQGSCSLDIKEPEQLHDECTEIFTNHEA